MSNLTGRIALAGRIALQFCQRFLVLQLGGLIFFERVICNKQIITCWEPDIVFIHSFLIAYRSLARKLARSRYGIKNSWINDIRLLTCNNLYLRRLNCQMGFKYLLVFLNEFEHHQNIWSEPTILRTVLLEIKEFCSNFAQERKKLNKQEVI